VVADDGIARSAARSWFRATPGQAGPVTEVRQCEWHLARQVANALTPLPTLRDPRRREPLLAMTKPETWGRYRGQLLAAGQARAVAAYDRIDAVVTHQLATRRPEHPNTTGPLEEFFHNLKADMGDRAARMTNKRRTDALLMLLAAARNGWADEHAWAEVVRVALTARGGVAPTQRQVVDPRGKPSLR
jgi:hypothetical protein